MAVERQCEWCGKKFYTYPSKIKLDRGRFCSRICYKKQQKDGGITKACEWCGKEFHVGPYRAKKGLGRFCSHACYWKWQPENTSGEGGQNWKGGKVKKTCEICKKEFEIVPSREDEARFCSLKCYGLWLSENQRGENHPRWKERVRKVCEQCGKEIYVLPRTVKKGWGQFCDRACQAKWQSENTQGENSWNWKGGRSFEPYAPEFNGALKRKIQRRDNYTCTISGKVWQLGQRKFPVHHIDYDKTNHDPYNLITLNEGSHARTNFNRRHWQALLTHAAKGAEMRANAFVKMQT